MDLAKTMVEEFWDKKNGGFFFTSQNGDEAVPRLKQTYDGAIPSGNSVALLDLFRLARLSGDLFFESYAQKLLNAFAEEVKSQPLGHSFMLVGLEFALGPTFNIVLVGEPSDKEMVNMLSAIRKNYLPNLAVKILSPRDKMPIGGIGYEKIDGKPTAYVCRDQTCMPPTNSVEKIIEYLKT